MAETLISSLIQKLESRGSEMPEYMKEEMGGVIHELTILLDLVRDERFGEGSSQYCSIREVVEIAEDALVPKELKGVFAFFKEIKFVKSLLGQTKMRMFQSGVSGDACSSLDQQQNKRKVGQNNAVKRRNASEALLVEMMQTVKREEIELLKMYETLDVMRVLYDELKEILDILSQREQESTVLNYDVCDVVVLANDLIEFYKSTDQFPGRDAHIIRCVGAVKTRMLSYSDIRPDDDGEADITNGDDVVGFENVMRLLLERVILYEGPGLFKLTIEGMAGTGKTALVRKMYSHARVVDKFKCRAWLRVPSGFSHKGMLMKLIQRVVDRDDDDDKRSLLIEKMMHADIPTLQQMLHQHLLGRQYLIVIDDVPEEMYLDIIYKGLPTEDERSRLLLTSRFENTQSIANRYKMIPLDPDESWELFMKTIFGGNKFTSDHEFPKQLERKAKEMLTKCGGVPSAIKNVGMQVARLRESGRKWEQHLELIDFDATLGFLEETYQSLDQDTKSCFLYLACFKENTTVRIDKLEHIFYAGAVGLKGRAEPCLIALVNRSFMEVEETKINIGDRTCTINVMLHRLAMKKAEEIGFEIMSNNGDTRRCQRPRHRVIKCSRDDSKFDYSTNQDKHLVSLFFHGGSSCYLDDHPFYWKSFESLKILNLDDFGLKVVPEGIGLLKNLTYLGLRNNYIRALPRSLGRLKKLEVLDIAENFMVEVPDIIWEMDSLLRLYMSDIVCPEPLKIGSQWNLVTLKYISIQNCTCLDSGSEKEIGFMKLGVEGLDESSDVSMLFASLANLRYLERLNLKGFRFKRMPCLDALDTLGTVAQIKLNGFLARLPRSFPPEMRCLSLVNTRLDEDPMPVLTKLPKLQYLKLQNAYTGEEMEVLDGEFPGLRVMRIKHLRYLRNLRVGKGAMAILEKLEIESCPYLETLPEEFGSMSKLMELKMVTTKTIERKIRKLGFISKIFNLSFHYIDSVVHL